MDSYPRLRDLRPENIFKWLEAQFPQVRTTGGFGTAPSRAPRPDQGPQGGGGGGARGNAWFGGRGNRLGD